MPTLDIIPIHELFGKDFKIPAYQRGYRWTDRQVLELLKDLYDFALKPQKEPGEYYCLQPIVVAKIDDSEYVLIDGQQRLTTLFLLLSFLAKVRKDNRYTDALFSLNYETRENSKQFLEKITTITEPAESDIDSYYMSQAYLTIKNWFEQNKIPRDKFLPILLDGETEITAEAKRQHNTARLIWYEVEAAEEQAMTIFTRINMGKVQLTNTELIKALFFQSANAEEKNRNQYIRALEWEMMEQTLQQDAFWYFLQTAESNTPTRMDLIFYLIAKQHYPTSGLSLDEKKDNYYSFYVFAQMISSTYNSNTNTDEDTRQALWTEVKQCHALLADWYEDAEFYNLIGLCIHAGTRLTDLWRNLKDKSRAERLEYLKDQIRSRLKLPENRPSIADLDYESNRHLIENLLLLFNVAGTNSLGSIKFAFEKYVGEKWSLEHIHAQNSDSFVNDADRRELMKEQLEFLQSLDQEPEIQEVAKQFEISLNMTTKLSDDKFKSLQQSIVSLFADDLSMHGIDNLALLSANMNSRLSNNLFPVKRSMIIKADSEGHFIPIATRNVFLKYYCPESDRNLQWNAKDRQAYLARLESVLGKYLTLHGQVAS